MNLTIVFSIIAAAISVGGVLIAIGMLKGKISQNSETGKAHEEQMKALASKSELAAAIKRSDEMLEIMKQRAEEDRAKGQGQWKEFYGLLNGQEKRIIALETQQTSFAKALDELKQDVKGGFRELQTELKTLLNEIREKESRK